MEKMNFMASLIQLDIYLFEIKARVDLLQAFIDDALEGQDEIDDEDERECQDDESDTLVHIYNAVYPILDIRYLFGEYSFSPVHYDELQPSGGPAVEYSRMALVNIEKRLEELIHFAERIDCHSFEMLAFSPLEDYQEWENWLDLLRDAHQSVKVLV